MEGESIWSKAYENILPLTPRNFKEAVLDVNGPVIVDFWLNKCGPCVIMDEHLKQIAHEWDIKVGKVDAMRDPDLADDYNVQSVPVVIVFFNGEEKQRFVGSRPIKKLQEEILGALQPCGWTPESRKK